MTQMRDCKYPHSANLFSFCKNVLSSKFGHARVIDQHVGQILGFDPADCSHWKRGRKSIRSFDAIQAIAKKLGVDERLVLDVARGDLTDAEAMLELSEVPQVSSFRDLVAVLRAEGKFQNAMHWSNDLTRALEDYLGAADGRINDHISEIHRRINFQEVPLLFPELWSAYPSIKVVERAAPDFVKSAAWEFFPRALKGPNETMEIHIVRETMNRSRIRFMLAEFLAEFFLDHPVDSRISFLNIEQKKLLMKYLQATFAKRLMVPAHLVRQEIKSIDLSKDMVGQLAERFWVSRRIINVRLKEIVAGAIL